jgi:hypothetical protein
MARKSRTSGCRRRNSTNDVKKSVRSICRGAISSVSISPPKFNKQKNVN